MSKGKFSDVAARFFVYMFVFMMFDRPPLYRGSIDCLIKTVRQEGFFALYKGLFPTYCRMVSQYKGHRIMSAMFDGKDYNMSHDYSRIQHFFSPTKNNVFFIPGIVFAFQVAC